MEVTERELKRRYCDLLLAAIRLIERNQKNLVTSKHWEDLSKAVDNIKEGVGQNV